MGMGNLLKRGISKRENLLKWGISKRGNLLKRGMNDCLFSVLAYCFAISKRTRSEKDLEFIKSIDSKFESNHAILLT